MISTDLNVDRAKRIARRNAALRHDDVARASSFGLGLGLSFGFSALAGDGAAFYPTDIPNCTAFWDVTDYSTLTTGSTPLASGTSPPVVTSAGTRTAAGALRVEIQSSTTFRWCNDNTGTGSAAGFPGGQSGLTIPAGGAAFSFGNGLSWTFPAGTYQAGQVYQETVSDIASRVNGAHKLSQATTAKQATLRTGSGGIGNQITLKADGTDDTYFCSAIDLPAPATTPIWIWAIARYDVFTSTDAVFSGNSSCWVEPTSSTALRQVNGANGANTATYAVGTAARMIAIFKGVAGQDSLQWGSSVASGNNCGNSNSTAGFWIFSNRELALSQMNGSLCALGIWSSVVTGTNLTALEAWGSAKFGAGLF